MALIHYLIFPSTITKVAYPLIKEVGPHGSLIILRGDTEQ